MQQRRAVGISDLGCCLGVVLLGSLLLTESPARASCVPTATPGGGSTAGGACCSSATWHLSDSPVVVTSSVLVGGSLCQPPPVTPPILTIEPGVQVQVMPGRDIDVFGELFARGTVANPIVFTAAMVSQPWYGIRFEPGSVGATFSDGTFSSGSILEYVTVQFAKDTGSTLGVVALNGASPYLHELTVTQDRKSTRL